MSLDPIEERVLRRYTKAICHLNYAATRRRQLGFILGAGISDDLKIPKWAALLGTMEEMFAYKRDGSYVPESYRGEQLFQFFRKKKSHELDFAPREIKEAGVNTDWRQVVSEILYKNYSEGGKTNVEAFVAAIDRHPYLREIAHIAADHELVISHNFDSALEMAILTDPKNSRPTNRRYNVFWKPDPFLRPGMLNIYHPNGYVPIERLKGGSDSIILTEANFADHLANTNNVEASFLLSHLSNKTWLLIGHSLADGTLKNALRVHANRRPGHVSYYVHWVASGEESLSAEQREAIQEANFATYNLVTFFLTSDEIGALLRLVNREEADLYGDMTSIDLMPRYVYYICGAVSSGKSTVLSNLRSMATVEEWPDRMPAAMNKLSVDASDTEKENIDQKLEEAIWKKNEEISAIKIGLVAVDRAPLDFIAFPDDETEKPNETAKKRHDKVLRRLEQQSFNNLCQGQIILVITDPKTLLERQIQRGRRPTDEDLRSRRAEDILCRQQNLMKEIYEAAINEGSHVKGDCCSIATCVQDVVRIIYFGDYKPFEFKSRLETYVGAS
jgi:adenylate kinase